jgi:serine/threonine-protein kinase
MELLEGPSLLDLLSKERVLRVRRAAEIAVPVCEVLKAAHEAGVIHRDIKPANILLAQSARGETVKVLDFGIAKLMDEVRDSAPVTAGGQVIGTPHYMAPERLVGAQADERSDIFSVGALLFQMLSGRLPFGFANSSPLRQALQQLQSSPLQLASVRADLPHELTQVVMRCVLYEPSMRPTLAELSHTLRRMAETWQEPCWPPALAEDQGEADEASGRATTVPSTGRTPSGLTGDEDSGVKPSSVPPPPGRDRLTRPRSARARRRKG